MAKKNILIAWIGYADLTAMAASQPPDIADRIKQIVRTLDRLEGKLGPIKTMLSAAPWDRICLLSTFEAPVTRAYRDWLDAKVPVEIYPIDQTDPTHYHDIFTAANSTLKTINQSWPRETCEFHYLLSSGTNTMVAIWLLLGKTRYPGQFWQTWKDTARREEIPFDIDLDYLAEHVKGAGEVFAHLAQYRPSELRGFEGIIGDSQPIRKAVGQAYKAAALDVSVLLIGASGTGKELFAHAIHQSGPRRDQPFVPVNCAAMPRELLESELFGHVKGAFTGAVSNKAGAFAQADGGVLFLDEIGECDPTLQAKLLRVLEPPHGGPAHIREFTPVGAVEPLRADVQIIAATNRDLHAAISAHRFRDDLYYRLAQVVIKLPPLDQHRDDIPAICQNHLNRLNARFADREPGREPRTLSPGALNFLKNQPWPGNIRQMINTLTQTVIMSETSTIQKEELAAATDCFAVDPAARNAWNHPLGNGFNLADLLEKIRAHYFQRALDQAHGELKTASKLLGYNHWQTFDKQLQNIGLKESLTES